MYRTRHDRSRRQRDDLHKGLALIDQQLASCRGDKKRQAMLTGLREKAMAKIRHYEILLGEADPEEEP